MIETFTQEEIQRLVLALEQIHNDPNLQKRYRQSGFESYRIIYEMYKNSNFFD